MQLLWEWLVREGGHLPFGLWSRAGKLSLALGMDGSLCVDYLAFYSIKISNPPAVGKEKERTQAGVAQRVELSG